MRFGNAKNQFGFQKHEDKAGPPFEMNTPGKPFIEVEDGDNPSIGTNFDDLLEGDREDNVILAGNGDDTVFGQPAYEGPFPEDDNDTIYGENGDDILNGMGGNDVVYGNNGDDIVQGGINDDELYGNNGDDILYGRFADDNNINSGDDLLDGGRGDDVLLGGSGSNVLTGGRGADSFVFAESSGFFRNDGTFVTNSITDLEGGDSIVFENYTEPTLATGGDGSLDNAQEVQAWIDALGDAANVNPDTGNLDIVWGGDTLSIQGDFTDMEDAVNLLGSATITWTQDAMIA